jgi:hypothetical protein
MTVRERDSEPVVVSMPAVVASHAQLRLAVARGGAVRRALQAMGLQHVLPMYPTVAAALAPGGPGLSGPGSPAGA